MLFAAPAAALTAAVAAGILAIALIRGAGPGRAPVPRAGRAAGPGARARARHRRRLPGDGALPRPADRLGPGGLAPGRPGGGPRPLRPGGSAGAHHRLGLAGGARDRPGGRAGCRRLGSGGLRPRPRPPGSARRGPRRLRRRPRARRGRRPARRRVVGVPRGRAAAGGRAVAGRRWGVRGERRLTLSDDLRAFEATDLDILVPRSGDRPEAYLRAAVASIRGLRALGRPPTSPRPCGPCSSPPRRRRSRRWPLGSPWWRRSAAAPRRSPSAWWARRLRSPRLLGRSSASRRRPSPTQPPSPRLHQRAAPGAGRRQSARAAIRRDPARRTGERTLPACREGGTA